MRWPVGSLILLALLWPSLGHSTETVRQGARLVVRSRMAAIHQTASTGSPILINTVRGETVKVLKAGPKISQVRFVYDGQVSIVGWMLNSHLLNQEKPSKKSEEADDEE